MPKQSKRTKQTRRQGRRQNPRQVRFNPFDYRIPGNRPAVVRRSQVTIVTSQATGSSGFFFTANPSSSPNFDAEFGVLFSVYKAVRTTFHWIPCNNTNELVSGDLVFATPVYTVVDPAVTSVPTTEADMLQYGSFKATAMWQSWKRTIRPSIAMSLNSGNAFPPASNFWVSIGSDPQMNGLRMLVPDMGQSATTPLGRMITTFEFLVNGTS